MNQESTKTDPDILVEDDEGLAVEIVESQQQNYGPSNQIYIFCAVHTLTLILYLQYNSNLIYLVQHSPKDQLSYKIMNDYAYTSIKLVYHNQTFSYYLYKIGLIIFWIQLFSIICLFVQAKYQSIQYKVLSIVRQLSSPYLISAILAWFMIYASGQLVQLLLYNYIYEVEKLQAYQKNLEEGQGDKKPKVDKNQQKQIEKDEGQITFYSWVILFGFCVILVSFLKCCWIVLGQLYYKRLLLIKNIIKS